MFAKPARFQGMGPRHTAPSKAAHCNDNHPARRAGPVSQRALRRVLVCGWRQVPATGRLECFWQVCSLQVSLQVSLHVVPVDAAAAEEPGISWLIGRGLPLLGIRITATPPLRPAQIVVNIASCSRGYRL